MLHTKRPALRVIPKKKHTVVQPVRSRALEKALAAVSELCATAGEPAGIDLDVYLESIDAGLSETQALALARQGGDAPLAANAERPAIR